MINKIKNLKYSGTPSLPLSLGDRYYSQDFSRDFNFFLDRIGLLMKDMKRVPVIISGGAVSQGAGDTLNITSCVAYVKHNVTIPDTFSALPPSVTTADLEGIRVSAPTQVNLAIPSATLDGVTWNIVKLKYKEVDLNTRDRAKKSGNYAYEIQPSFEYVIDSTATDDYHAVLCKFTGTPGGTFVFDWSDRTSSGVDTGLKNGLNVYSGRIAGSISSLSLPDGKIYNSIGYMDIGNIAIIEKTSNVQITNTGMSQGYWYLVYLNISGNFEFELTSNTTYGVIPIAEIDALAPMNQYRTARYKAFDPSKRLVAAVYSMPAQTAWNSGTTYSKGQLCSSGGHIYVSKQDTNLNNVVTDTSWWYDMGADGEVFAPMVFNFPEPIFGTGSLGDITLANGNIIEAGWDYTNGTLRGLEYHFNKVELEASAVVHIGRSAAAAIAVQSPVILKIRDYIKFNTSSQLNGNGKGITGGAGGAGNTNRGAGGAGANSGFPLHLIAREIVDLTSSSSIIIDNAPGLGGNGGVGTDSGGGGGGASTSGLYILTKKILNIRSKIKLFPNLEINHIDYAGGAFPGFVDNAGIGGYLSGSHGFKSSNSDTLVINYSRGAIGGGNGGYAASSVAGGGGGAGGVTGGAGGAGAYTGHGGAGGGLGDVGAASITAVAAGGGGGGLGCGGSSGASAGNVGNAGSYPAVPHITVGGYCILEDANQILSGDLYDR